MLLVNEPKQPTNKWFEHLPVRNAGLLVSYGYAVVAQSCTAGGTGL
jgi:hypothetical protein